MSSNANPPPGGGGRDGEAPPRDPATAPTLAFPASPEQPGKAGAHALGPGAALGRYVLLYRVGTGGMGEVWAAYDPELDRKVAVKVVHAVRRSAAARQRLLREAQAAAQLSHRNVVAVHDVGTSGDEVFIAMELVDGGSGEVWLEQRRPWREVVDQHVRAGRGLAAAHAAGLVHRDFKPHNVLIGKDGSVRVADFGLARAAEQEPFEDSGEPEKGEAGSLLSAQVTRPGRVAGTPGYLAPEVIQGRAATAAADQFSFCASLYHALYGESPFAGGSHEEVLAATLEGRLRPVPAAARAPAWLRPVLERGLATAPEDRYPSMEALLAALSRDPAAHRRRWALAAGAALAVGGLAYGVARWQQGLEELCVASGPKLAAVWSPEKRARAATAFRATGLPFAAVAWERAASSLDAYSASWATQHLDACEATHRRHEQSEELLDRRMFCLDQRLDSLSALVSVFETADAGVVERAPDAVRALPPLAACADAEALLARVPPPRDPARRARVEAVSERLSAAQASAAAGRDRAALAQLDGLAAEAAEAGYKPLEARVLYLRGFLEERVGRPAEAEPTLFAALVAAAAGGDDEVAALAAGDLAFVTGARLHRGEEGRRWAELSAAQAEGLGGDPLLRAQVLLKLGSVVVQQGRLQEALELYDQAGRVAAAAAGEANPVSAAAHSNRAVVFQRQGRYEEALAASRRSLALRREALEPDHPDLAKSYNEIGNALGDLDRKDEAVEAYRQALDSTLASYGPRHPRSLGIRVNQGILLKDLGRLAEAEATYREALAVAEQIDESSPLNALILTNLGDVLLLRERWQEALAVYQRAYAIDAAALPAGHPDLAYGLAGIGAARLALGRAGEAVEPLEAAWRLRRDNEVAPELLAEAQFLLARALWDAGGDRARSRGLARRARELRREQGPAGAEVLEQIDAWLAAR